MKATVVKLICHDLNCNFLSYNQKRFSILFVALSIIALTGLIFFLFVNASFNSFLGTKLAIGILCPSIPLLAASSMLLSSVVKAPFVLLPYVQSHVESERYFFDEWEPSLHPLDNQIFEEPKLSIVDAIKLSLKEQFKEKVLKNQYLSLIHHSKDKRIFYAICYRNKKGFFTEVFADQDNASSFILTLRKDGLKTIYEENSTKKLASFNQSTLRMRHWILGEPPFTKHLLPKKSFWPSSEDDFWWVITHHEGKYVEVRYYSSAELRDHYISLLEGYQNSYLSWRISVKQFL